MPPFSTPDRLEDHSKSVEHSTLEQLYHEKQHHLRLGIGLEFGLEQQENRDTSFGSIAPQLDHIGRLAMGGQHDPIGGQLDQIGLQQAFEGFHPEYIPRRSHELDLHFGVDGTVYGGLGLYGPPICH